MQKIVTAAQMREIDRRTIEDRGIPSLILMENAGARIYEYLAQHFSPLSSRRLIVIAGKGNNGGDGLVSARHLTVRTKPLELTVVVVGDPQKFNENAAANYRMLQAVDCNAITVCTRDDWKLVQPKLISSHIVIDALLGTGLRKPLTGLYEEIIEDINTHCNHCEKIAVDMPTGVPTDSGEPNGKALSASTTITFTTPKISQIFFPNSKQVGKLVVKPIGTAPSMLSADPQLNLALIEPGDFQHLLAARPPSSHKGNFGHVFVIGGTPETPGAALMTASAATASLRTGAGRVTVATSENTASSLIAHTPELMTLHLPTDKSGQLDSERFTSSCFNLATVLALGPGLGVSPGSVELTKRIMLETHQPLVIDADAINCLSKITDWQCDRQRPVILTPHPGEMARLTGNTTDEIQANRIEIARNYAAKHGTYLVLKGHRTLIATPEGLVMVNPTGTPAMATAGSGDILTGIIAGLLAQFPHEQTGIVIAAAVYLHGLSAELAASETTELAMLATDTLQFLPAAIQKSVSHFE